MCHRLYLIPILIEQAYGNKLEVWNGCERFTDLLEQLGFALYPKQTLIHIADGHEQTIKLRPLVFSLPSLGYIAENKHRTHYIPAVINNGRRAVVNDKACAIFTEQKVIPQ